ncbi:ribosomal RNA processing protein 1 homolog Nnp-1 isoform X1 [Osmia lignaria lignaria]|uniref:ribosomal RNA processing protein 1 homolog Nnp-1 isoform X1 n=2 Tax=Osmia lignaria lignaria TaxID=1437193 RepID=UPI00402B51A1
MAVKKVQRNARASLRKAVQQVQQKEKKQVTPTDVKDKKVVVIVQEIKFVRLLSSNDKRVRERVLKNLRKWLTVRSVSSFAFTKLDFMRLWKGLFYCMWMSDKPLIQEELAESLSKLVHCFNSKDVVLLYTTCALETLGIEWIGIDQYRLDKFSMLARRVIRQTFQMCKNQNWDMEWIKDISEIIENCLINPQVCIGFNMHLTEVFLEELAKISEGNISEDVVTVLIKPFVTYFIRMDDGRRIGHVMKHIFRYLIFQSDIGMDYMDKFKAWRAAGFPTGSIDVMDKIEVSDEEIEGNDEVEEENSFQNQCHINKPLDPRAGRVDVELPQILFNPKKIAELLSQYKFHPSSTARSRRQLRRLINEFEELSQGKMPVGVKEVVIPEMRKRDTNTKLAAKRFLEFQEELYSDKPQKLKRKQNEQLIQDEKDESTEEGLENVNAENSTTKVNEKIVKKKKKVQSKMSDTDNLINSEESNEDTIDLKNKKCNTAEMIRKNSNFKFKKESPPLVKKCKKLKLKGNKTTSASILNISPVKRKKSTMLTISDKWDVSDNIDSSSSLSLSNGSDSNSEKNNILTKQPTWLVPVLKKLENEKSRTTSAKMRHKISADSNPKKRVKIALQRNTAQHTSEYILQIQKSPGIPFDANRKPSAGVLKASPIPSPINPFYKRKII